MENSFFPMFILAVKLIPFYNVFRLPYWITQGFDNIRKSLKRNNLPEEP